MAFVILHLFDINEYQYLSAYTEPNDVIIECHDVVEVVKTF